MDPVIAKTSTSNPSNDFLNDKPPTNEMATTIKGVVVLARNGDRMECYQDPKSYKYGTTESTPFGEVWISASRSCFVAPL